MPYLLLRGENIGKVKGVLFDKDGTLSNSEQHLLKLASSRLEKSLELFKEEMNQEIKLEVLSSMLKKAFGIKNKSIDPSGTIAIASRQSNLISTATVFCLMGLDWSYALTMASHIFKEVDSQESLLGISLIDRPLLLGAKEALKRCNVSNIQCALISNDSKAGITNFLEGNDLTSLFSTFWSAENDPPKPNPQAVLKICERLNLKPSECALIGDCNSDLKMARDAGIQIRLGFTGGWSSQPTIDEHHHLISHWDELVIG